MLLQLALSNEPFDAVVQLIHRAKDLLVGVGRIATILFRNLHVFARQCLFDILLLREQQRHSP